MANLNQTMPTTSLALNYLYQLQWHGIAPGLMRIERLMAEIGHPERSFPAVHIAGTNGKGSTAAMIASVLQQTGRRVGLYTSPHLIDFSERICINGVPISPPDIARLTHRLRTIVEATPQRLEITFFELTTAMAFLYFAEQAIDIGIIEVGLGGRWDATNVVAPRVCAITHIGYDHERYLGASLEEIAFEKAGIIKPGVPVVLGVMPERARFCIEGVARQNHAPCMDTGVEAEGLMQAPCPLRGAHQMRNMAVALRVLAELGRQGISVSQDQLQKGMEETRWPGRCEMISEQPQVLLDGAHNPAGVSALIGYLETLRVLGTRRLMFGAMQDKKIAAMLPHLAAWAHEIVLTRPDHPRAAHPHEIAALLPDDYPHQIFSGFYEAMIAIAPRLRQEDVLVITGSLYLIGEARAHFTAQEVSPLRG